MLYVVWEQVLPEIAFIALGSLIALKRKKRE